MLRSRLPVLAAGLWMLGVGSAIAPAFAGDGSTREEPVAGDEGQADFNRELLTVEEQVDSLKERVFRSKATLQLLKEIVIEGSSSGARATIWHVNRLSSGFRLESVQYLLDGQSKFSKADPAGSLDQSREFKIHDGAVPPGNHNLSIDLKIRPTGMGIFTYAKNYEINVRSNYAFNAELGKTCTVRAVVSDRGGVVNSFEERAKVDFELKCERISDGK
ncbi:MAG: hypothetical protein FJ102_07520 [Deltaproteobacteria bacterium]|nr:hypothetical protein [Deltaproteobacteria bacterium]